MMGYCTWARGVSFDFGSRLYIHLWGRMYNLLPPLRTNGGEGGRVWVMWMWVYFAQDERRVEGGRGLARLRKVGPVG